MMTEEKQIEGRLSLLYAISLSGQSAPISRLKHLFQNGLNRSDEEWENLLHDILQSDLVKKLSDHLIISDNGMVVLSFFQDRIPGTIIEQLDQLTNQSNSLSNYEWQSWYDQRHNILQIMQLKDHQRILGIQLYLTPEEMSAFEDLQFSPNEDFIEALKTLLLTQKET